MNAYFKENLFLLVYIYLFAPNIVHLRKFILPYKFLEKFRVIHFFFKIYIYTKREIAIAILSCRLMSRQTNMRNTLPLKFFFVL